MTPTTGTARADSPAAELRAAASLMRQYRGPSANPDDFWPALADWLVVKAANLERVEIVGAHYRDHDYGYALAVARAYLNGETADA